MILEKRNKHITLLIAGAVFSAVTVTAVLAQSPIKAAHQRSSANFPNTPNLAI
jgi:hypothetical protein